MLAKANYELLKRYGPIFGIPECSYIQNKRNINTEKKHSIGDTDIAYAIRKSFYRILTSNRDRNNYCIAVTKLTPAAVYRTSEYNFTLRLNEGGNVVLCYEETNYRCWNDFIESLPFMTYVVPAPEDRYTRYLEQRRKQLKAEKKIEQRRLKQAIEDYHCRF